MKESTTKPTDQPSSKTEKKPGFFGRMVQKLDDSMKQKAEEKAQPGSCCGGGDGKGDKCC